MKSIQFTLVTDGPSDGAMLVPILEWLLRSHCKAIGVNVVYADVGRCRVVPKRLEEKIEFAIEAYPCECVFIHRDAETEHSASRREEIGKAVAAVGAKLLVSHVCVIPIRMTEAWLLFNESAIRHASGNPNGKIELAIPSLTVIEDNPDPKQLLHELLTLATEFSGRRRKKFDPRSKIRLVAQYPDDFSPLRQLSAFRVLESEVLRIIQKHRWDVVDT